MIKTFRGLIASGAQDTIVLHTNDGSTGYRIVKFQCIQSEPGELSVEQTMKIYKVSQTTIDNTVDFSDNTLLAVGGINQVARHTIPQRLLFLIVKYLIKIYMLPTPMWEVQEQLLIIILNLTRLNLI